MPGDCTRIVPHTRTHLQQRALPPLPPRTRAQWVPTREGYLRFLAESKAVYDALEAAVQDEAHPECELRLHGLRTMHGRRPELHRVWGHITFVPMGLVAGCLT
jgi:hypothetical protein